MASTIFSSPAGGLATSRMQLMKGCAIGLGSANTFEAR